MNKMTGNGKLFTTIGIAGMILLTLTKIVPSSQIAGFSVFVGIAFFFIEEAVSKTKGDASGLRFHTLWADMKKPGVILWVLLPVISAVITFYFGNLLFHEEYVIHLFGRTDQFLSFDRLPLMVGQVVIAAFGEEIAYRGFFLGKGMKHLPFWLCALLSSAVFAAGHIAVGSIWLVVFDIAMVYIDSIIYSIIYRKCANCVVSTISHILGNATGIIAMLCISR